MPFCIPRAEATTTSILDIDLMESIFPVRRFVMTKSDMGKLDDLQFNSVPTCLSCSREINVFSPGGVCEVCYNMLDRDVLRALKA